MNRETVEVCFSINELTQEIRTIIGKIVALIGETSTYLIVSKEFDAAANNTIDNIEIVKKNTLEGAYSETISDLLIDISTLAINHKVNNRQKRIGIITDSLFYNKDLKDSVNYYDYAEGFDYLIRENEIESTIKEKVLKELNSAPSEEIVFVSRYLNKNDKEHQIILQLAEHIKNSCERRIILVGGSEYEWDSDDIADFDTGNIFDIKLSREQEPAKTKAILNNTKGCIIVFSKDADDPVLSERHPISEDTVNDLLYCIIENQEKNTLLDKLEEVCCENTCNETNADEAAAPKGTTKDALIQSLLLSNSFKCCRLASKFRLLFNRSKRPLVSVIVPFYNDLGTIEATLNSVKKCGYSNLEVLLISDGSEQDPGYIAERYKFVKTFYKDNEGLGSARNKGLAEAKGKYVIFLDSDDTFCAGGVRHLVEYAENNNLVVTSGRTKRVELSSGQSRYWRKTIYRKNYINDRAHRQLLIDDTLSTAKLYRTDFLRENNHYFEKGLFEDMLFISDIYNSADRIGVLKRDIQNWMIYGIDTSITTQIKVENVTERIRRLNQVFDKQYGVRKIYYTAQFINHQLIYCINGFCYFDKSERETIYRDLRNAVISREQYVRKSMVTSGARFRMAEALLADDYEVFEAISLSYSKRYVKKREAASAAN